MVESHPPEFPVEVCVVVSAFVHVTVAPTGMVTGLGE
jgi:hypothetical protein